MRILFINRMAAMVRGGGETFDLEMARHLAALGCEVTFLTGIPLFGKARLGPAEWWGGGSADFRFQISEVHIRTPYLGWFPWDKVRGGWRVRWADFVMFERAAVRWAWAHRAQFDVIQVCELVTVVNEWKHLSSQPSPPIAMRLTAPDFFDPHGALQKADAVIASGTTMKRMQAGPRPDCHNIPNGVDTGLFRPHPTSFRTQQGWADDDFIILSVARFQAVKNHAMLVEAFRRVLAEEPRARLVLAGSGPLEASVRAACAAAGVTARVSFLGERPFDQVADLYASAQVAVISSDYESFSFVALEAMATGLPLVVTATEWVPGLIGRADVKSGMGEVPGGLVSPMGDAGAFAQALLRLIRDPAERARMGVWNRDRAMRDFGWTTSARTLLEVYRALSRIRGAGRSDQ